MTVQTEPMRMPKRAKMAIESELSKTASKPPVKIEEVAVLLNVNMSRMHVWRKASTAKVSVEADEEGIETEKDALAVNKEILKCEELRVIMRLDDEVRRYLYSRCLPSVFKRGVYLLPLALLDEVMDKLAEFEGRRAEMVSKFCAVYSAEAALAKKRLGALYDPADYPPVETVRTLFQFETQLMEMSVPAQLKTLKAELYRKELRKAQEMWDRSKGAITATLYEEFGKLVERLATKLKSRPDGGRQIFRDSTVENLQDWLRVFDARNLTDDQDIVTLVEEARSLIQGVKPDTIRESTGLREELAQKFGELSKVVEAKIEELPDRAISFD